MNVALQDRLSRAGFDPVRLGFAWRTALAACLALLAAWLMGLEHPQWSAMTVWGVSQPVRGMLVEKSFFRAAGTLVGTAVGLALMIGSGNDTAILVAGLALWVGVCAGAGNLVRGLASYGTILAGYSAAMVALLGTGSPEGILHLAADRLMTVLTGVVVALAVGLAATGRPAENPAVRQMRRLMAEMLRSMAAMVAGQGAPQPRLAAMLRELAASEAALESSAAGSLRSHRSARALRAVLSAQVAALLWMRRPQAVPAEPRLAEALQRAADLLEGAGGLPEIVAALHEARGLAAGSRGLQAVLSHLATALRARLPASGDGGEERAVPLVMPHRDWVGARQALLRAAGVMLVVGGVWLATGWTVGPYVLLGTAVMISLFSTFENPALMMAHVAIGQFFGAVAAIACQWLVWPHVGGEAGKVLAMLPFIVLGALPLAHRRTKLGGMDFNMVLLLLLQPVAPHVPGFSGSVAMALAVVSGPVLALIAYGLVFRTDARRRMEAMAAIMVRELQAMARRRDAPLRLRKWRGRLQHRLPALVRWTEVSGGQPLHAADACLAVQDLAMTILQIRRLLRSDALRPGTRRSLDVALGRLQELGKRPERALAALELAGVRLAREGRPEARRLLDAAGGLAAHAGFFRLPA
ncbi:FUSC family protein [Geminicoccaceae bacterium 1502E]|nr:FUSC family protein [Geminicoccaceae bacterium 1502E]